MAHLTHRLDGDCCYLKAYHVFGRLEESVNTLINKPEISKIHAIIEWKNPSWFLTDFSSNGTWLNQVKVTKNASVQINQNDIISFATKDLNEFVVEDVSSPCDRLVPIDKSSPVDGSSGPAIVLKPYNLLPSDEQPELSLVYDEIKGQWMTEDLFNNTQAIRMLKPGDVIELSGCHWQLEVNTKLEETRQLTPSIDSINELSFLFNVSADEESTQLILQLPDESIDLKIRTHHYLTLILARQRIEDIKNQLPETEQGWIYSDQLCKDLGLEQCHMNIQVHRARKQFSECFNNNHLTHLFDRQSGKIRLGTGRIMVTKSGVTEFRFNDFIFGICL